MTVPVGYPSWTRTASIEQYGGDLAKRNWGGTGAIDALTDVTAEQLTRLTADLAAVVRPAPMATIRIFDSNARSKTTSASLADIQVLSAACQWGIATGAYQGDTPPAGFPSVTIASTIYGRGYVLDFGASQNDDYGVAGAIDIKCARVQSTCSGFLEVPEVTWSGSTVSFVRFDGTDVWTGAADMIVTVW